MYELGPGIVESGICVRFPLFGCAQNCRMETMPNSELRSLACKVPRPRFGGRTLGIVRKPSPAYRFVKSETQRGARELLSTGTVTEAWRHRRRRTEEFFGALSFWPGAFATILALPLPTNIAAAPVHRPDMSAAKPGQGVTAQRQDCSAEEGEEQRLQAALRHLQTEAGVLERLVYKHRNQHRSTAYFQYLIKARRDLKLLLGSNLAEVINAVFPVIACRKPANTILVPNRQGKRKPGANHSHYKRLLGVARLLSQMVEPVIKGAVQITFLLARSFFIEFCTAVLALLARVRVLIQQMLIDVVSVYNKVTDLTDRKQAVKITIDKVQAYREYYPSSNDPSTILECVWVKDKFVLHEMTKGSYQKTQDKDHKSCAPDSSIQYETLGPISKEMENFGGSSSPAKQQHASLVEQPDKATHCGDAGDPHSGRQSPDDEDTTGSLPDALAAPVPVRLTPRTEIKPDMRKRVAFIAVGKTKVTVTAPEISSVVTKKQRVAIIPHATEYRAL